MARETSQQIEKTGRAETALGFVVLGMLVAGFVGLWKASKMTTGADVMFCLFGAVTAFGAVYYILFAKQ